MTNDQLLANEQVRERKPLAMLITMMMNPRGAINQSFSKFPWFISVVISGLAFGTFFLQTGLDLWKTGQEGFLYVIKITSLGVGFGLVGIPLMAVLMWPVLKFSKSDMSFKSTISFVCLSYSAALVYGVVGLLFSVILGWKTALSFGATGVLWSLGPLMISLRQALKDKIVVAVILTSLAGAFILFAWQYLQLV